MRTRSIALALAALLAAMAAIPATASAAGPANDKIDVTLRAGPTGFVVPSAFVVQNEALWLVDPVEQQQTTQAPGVAGCELTVADRNGDGVVDGADVLNRAEDTGCITSWDGRNHDSCTDGAILVSEVDGLEEIYPATFWIVHRNGELASDGICGLALEDGESLSFVYE
jgi:hypothetical protein